MSKNGKAASAPVLRTSRGLRAALFDEIDAVRQGNSPPSRANSIARLATVIVENTRLELDVVKYLRTIPNDEPTEVLDKKIESGLAPASNMKLG